MSEKRNSDRSVVNIEHHSASLIYFLLNIEFFSLLFCYITSPVICVEGRQPSLMHSKQKRFFFSLSCLPRKLILHLNGYKGLNTGQLNGIFSHRRVLWHFLPVEMFARCSPADDVLLIAEVRFTPPLRSSRPYPRRTSLCSVIWTWNFQSEWQDRRRSCLGYRCDNDDNRVWTDNVRCIDTLIELAATRVLLFYSPWSTQSIIGVETGCSPRGSSWTFEDDQTSRGARRDFSFSVILSPCRVQRISTCQQSIELIRRDLFTWALGGEDEVCLRTVSIGRTTSIKAQARCCGLTSYLFDEYQCCYCCA